MLRDWFILKKASHSHVFVLISAAPLTLCWMAKSEFLIKIYLNQCWHLEELHYLWNQCILGGRAIFWALLRFSFGNLMSGGDFNLRCSFLSQRVRTFFLRQAFGIKNFKTNAGSTWTSGSPGPASVTGDAPVFTESSVSYHSRLSHNNRTAGEGWGDCLPMQLLTFFGFI